MYTIYNATRQTTSKTFERYQQPPMLLQFRDRVLELCPNSAWSVHAAMTTASTCKVISRLS
jgi:hypothetical protein